jgi:exopolysaccharide biosynthesis polyprenyl glycosylphosphotransferase
MYQQRVAEHVAKREADTRAGNGQWGYAAVKRAMDLTFSMLALITIFPILVVIAIAIKLDSPGPVLFRQTRVGKGGNTFNCYKFRTMIHNADPEVHRRYVQSLIRNQAQASDRQSKDGAASVYKLQRDPRITRVGAFLRRTSLDELPQFFNVVRGDMSLVGPRPPLPYEVQEYQDWHLARLTTLPGITGWWQVRGRSRVSFDDMVRMDIEYINHQSLWLDIKILLLTVPAVLAGHGAM